jgi:hypothetical protein
MDDRSLTRKERKVIAHHEAGHAVVAHALKLRVTKIRIGVEEIERDGVMRTAGGSVTLSGDHLRAGVGGDAAAIVARAVAQANLISTLAGPAAQRKYAPRSRVPYAARFDDDDADDLAVLLARCPAGETALRRFAYREAAALVAAEWPAVEALAAELMTRDEISGEEMIEIIRPIQEARAARIAPALDLLPTQAEAEEHTERKRRKARPVSKRVIADAIFCLVERHLAAGDRVLDFAELRAQVETWALLSRLDPENALQKLDALVEKRRDQIQWRAVG